MNSNTPKPLHKICGKEMLNMILESCKLANLATAITIVPEKFDNFKTATKYKTEYITQKQAKGSGDALSLISQSEIPDNIIVLNGDIPLIKNSTLTKLMENHIESNAPITLLTSTPPDNNGLGRILRNSENNILSIVEENDTDNKTRDIKEINVGVYCFKSSWLMKSMGNLKPLPINLLKKEF